MAQKNTIKPRKSTTKSPAWTDLDSQDILLVNKEGKIFLGGQLITQAEVQNLQQEIKSLKQFKIWRILQETLRHKAVEKAVTLSENWEQVLSGKMMLHSLGVMKSIVHVLEHKTFPQPTGQAQKGGTLRT
jgi:hypothetical protein